MAALQSHLADPPFSDLEGGITMIVELAVNMTAFIPQESREVQIEYYLPGTRLAPEYMKPEQPGLIPALADSASPADDPHVRLAVGLGASVRGRGVLQQAPVHVL